MSIYNCKTHPNHWNIIITKRDEDDIIIHTLISRKLQMIETKVFQILNPDVFKVLHS